MIYYCCANDQNIGDYFSMLGIEMLMGIKSEYILMSGTPKVFEESLNRLSKGDMLIVGGGGLLKNHFEKYWEVIFKVQDKSKFDLASFGIGVCDIKGKSTILDEQFLKKIINRNKALYLRPYIPDIMKSHATEVFCPSNFYFSKCKNKRFLEETMLYVEHRKLIGEDSNFKIIDYLQRYCLKNNLKFQITNNTFPGNFEGLYNLATLVVSTRLHGLILAQALDKKIIPISNDFKIEGYANKLGVLENVIDLDKFSQQILEEKIDNYKLPKFSSEEVNEQLLESIESFKRDIGV